MRYRSPMSKLLTGSAICTLCFAFGAYWNHKAMGVIPLKEAKQTDCQWLFIKYIPSAYEKQWTANIGSLQHNVCAESNKQTFEINEWMAHTLSSQVFSHFIFRNNCTGEQMVDYIEPLAGLTRSPLFCLKGDEFVVQKDYLHVSSNVSKKSSHSSRSFYFDLGASTYDTGLGGPSQSWFVETYESKGIQWNGIYAWESTPSPPSDVWKLIPARLKPIYHWYNIPVNPGLTHPDNALEYIKKIANQQDYVLLKIDIDNNAVEEALVHQLLASHELLGLVDELYFEHHVNTAPMNKYWGTSGSQTTLQDTYKLFTALRNRGVVAHSWV